MNPKIFVKAVLPLMMAAAFAPTYAADPATGSIVASGEVTPRLYYFDYFGGTLPASSRFLQRYDYRQAIGGDRESGFYLGGDLDFRVSSPERDLLSLNWNVFSQYNQRGTARADSEKVGFSAFYSFFRTATGSLDYLYNPNIVPGGTDTSYCPAFAPPAGCGNTNSGYVAQFNNDVTQFTYDIDRTTYGAGIKLKPGLLGEVASVSLDYDGYKRKGDNFVMYVLGGGDTAPAPLQRWRGLTQPVDENLNRASFNATVAPGNMFEVAYDLVVDKFTNEARQFTFNDIVLPAGFTKAGDQTRPLGFVPDSSQISQGLRASANFGQVAVAAGYGHATLDQDSFTRPQAVAGYNTGEITTNSAFLNASWNVSNTVGLEGFIKYYNRENDSSFPVRPFIDTVTAERLGVRINEIDSYTYGLSATFRTAFLKSTIIPGWTYTDIDRDLTFHQATLVPAVNGIAAQRSLYRDETKSSELYVKLISRPMQGMTVRVTPKYIWADDTGLVTEIGDGFGLDAKVTYAAPKGVLVSGYYNYKNAKNDNNSFNSNVANSLASSGTVKQDTERTAQSAGVSLSMAPTEWANVSAGLSWLQNDFEAFYISTNRRRFEAPAQPVLFVTRDRPEYNVDTYVFNLGGDWQSTDALRFNGSYTFSQSNGDAASGATLAALPTVDGKIDNTLHTVALGVDYAFKRSLTFKGSYVYDYYKDKAYPALTGGVNTVMFGLSLGF